MEKFNIEDAQAMIAIKVEGTHTYFALSGEGVALEIAQEIVDIAKSMDSENLLGINVIKQRSN
tara:strand:- start:629 stop:817 length:189 start_codon:yes stop_codon:yes gene_type:complete